MNIHGCLLKHTLAKTPDESVKEMPLITLISDPALGNSHMQDANWGEHRWANFGSLQPGSSRLWALLVSTQARRIELELSTLLNLTLRANWSELLELGPSVDALLGPPHAHPYNLSACSLISILTKHINRIDYFLTVHFFGSSFIRVNSWNPNISVSSASIHQ